MRKLILVYSDCSSVFDVFTDIIRAKYPRVYRNDEAMLYTQYIANAFGEVSNKVDNKHFVNKIRKIVTEYTDYVYNSIILMWLSNYDMRNQVVFFRVDNFKTLNRLKRRYKRPNHTTLLLTNDICKFNKQELLAVNRYKFDYKIINHSYPQLQREAIRYVLKQLKIVNRYRDERN